MSEDQHLSDLIDLYLNGELTGKTLQEFEELLQQDSNLKQELELERALRNSVEIYGDTLLKDELAKEFQSAKKTHKLKRWAGYTLLALGVATTGYFVLSSETEQPKTPEVITTEISQEPLVEQNETTTFKEDTTSALLPKEKGPTQKISAPKKDATKTEIPTNVAEVKSIKVTKDSSISTSEVKKEKANTEDTVRKENRSVVELPVDPCKKTNLVGQIITKATCENTSEGSIEIINTKGGKTPYQFSLDKTNWQNAKLFLNLMDGNYSVFVKDANNCIQELKETANVESKNCYQAPKGFNPDFETWEYKISSGTEVKVTLRAKDGKVVLETKTDKNFIWDGKDQFGKRVPSGLYIYTIEGQSVEQGSVTVIY